MTLRPPPRTLWTLLRPFRRTWLTAVGALLLVHVIEALIPLCLKEGIDRIVANDRRLLAPVAAILALTVLRYATLSFGRRRNALLSTEISFGLRRAVYERLMDQGPVFFGRYALGDLMARATNDIEAIWFFFRSNTHRLVSMLALLIVAPAFMALQSGALTILVVALLAALTTVSWFLAGAIRQRTGAVHAGFGTLTEQVQQSLRGVHTIQAHAQEERETRQFRRISDTYAQASYRLARFNGLLNATVGAGGSAITLAVVAVGGLRVQAGAMSIGTLTSFIFYLSMIMWVVRQSAIPARHLVRAIVGIRRVSEILDAPPELTDTPEPSPLDTVRGHIALEDVAVRFPDGTEALRDVGVTIQPGELVAIVGRIGAGKSTLLRLLCRRSDPSAGRVALDGHDLTAIPLRQLRRTIAFVAQDSFLFAAPIGENISQDDPDRPAEAIWRAAEAAAIRAFPNGLDTPVGERGLTLSGGQRQRTSLARGIIRDTPVLLLDDCFSALDAETELQILRALRRLRSSRTTLFVTHRMSAARHADRILTLDEGRVVELGTPAELLAARGLYAGFVARQTEEAVAS